MRLTGSISEHIGSTGPVERISEREHYSELTVWKRDSALARRMHSVEGRICGNYHSRMLKGMIRFSGEERQWDTGQRTALKIWDAKR